MSMVNNTPLERHEQASFVDWLELQGLLFSATAQSTYTTSWNQKRLNHATGLRKGVPDMLVIIPKDKSKDGEGYCLFIELKRQNKSLSRVSKEQKEWIDNLANIGGGVTAEVCYGSDSAIRLVQKYIL